MIVVAVRSHDEWQAGAVRTRCGIRTQYLKFYTAAPGALKLVSSSNFQKCQREADLRMWQAGECHDDVEASRAVRNYPATMTDQIETGSS